MRLEFEREVGMVEDHGGQVCLELDVGGVKKDDRVLPLCELGNGTAGCALEPGGLARIDARREGQCHRRGAEPAAYHGSLTSNSSLSA